MRMSEENELAKAMQFLEDMAIYMEKRPTKGEDMVHWANVYNGANCRNIKERLRRMQVALMQSNSCMDTTINYLINSGRDRKARDLEMQIDLNKKLIK